jgi:lysine N6-hydroxylase
MYKFVEQSALYKGINFSLVNEIYDLLYTQSLQSDPRLCLFTHIELQQIEITNNGFDLKFYHTEEEKYFDHYADSVILATGYEQFVPGLLGSIKAMITLEDDYYKVNRNYSIDKNNTIFVQNSDLHSRGFNRADLGLGAYRNGQILNTILCQEHFQFERGICFNHFR